MCDKYYAANDGPAKLQDYMFNKTRLFESPAQLATHWRKHHKPSLMKAQSSGSCSVLAHLLIKSETLHPQFCVLPFLDNS